MIEHGQRVCKLTFERMVEQPSLLYGETIGSNYQRQTETLGKHFRLPLGPDGHTPAGRRVAPGQLELMVTDSERT